MTQYRIERDIGHSDPEAALAHLKRLGIPQVPTDNGELVVDMNVRQFSEWGIAPLRGCLLVRVYPFRASHALAYINRYTGDLSGVAEWQRAWGRCRCGWSLQGRSMDDVRENHRKHREEAGEAKPRRRLTTRN